MPAALVLSGMSAWLTGALLWLHQAEIPGALLNSWCGFAPHDSSTLSGAQHCAGCAIMVAGAAAIVGGLASLVRSSQTRVTT